MKIEHKIKLIVNGDTFQYQEKEYNFDSLAAACNGEAPITLDEWLGMQLVPCETLSNGAS